MSDIRHFLINLAVFLAFTIILSIVWNRIYGSQKEQKQQLNIVDGYYSADYTLAPISTHYNKIVELEGIITAYTSLPELTDRTPYITASGQKVRVGIIANNCLPFGSIVYINGQPYEVEDRMNRRYNCRHFDIWLPTYKQAKEFGLKKLKVIYYK